MNTRRFLTALLVVGGLSAAGAQVAAGTQITNQATATFTEPDATTPTTAYSNIVTTVVSDICGVSITSNGTVANPWRSVNVLGGETVVFPYTVTNTGNGTGDFAVNPRIEGGSAFTPTLTAYLDANGNGQIDAGEQPVTSVTLPAGASAALLVQAVTAESAPEGSAFINLVSACPAGDSEDANNIAELQIGAPPPLGVDKTFAPTEIRPGEQTTVTVSVSNAGNRTSREVVLSDDLAAQRAAGLNFVAGSARATAGRIEYFDGRLWSATEPAEVRGIRVVADSLAAGASINLTFKMQAGAAADGEDFVNVALARTGTSSVSDDAALVVKYNPAVAIGPVGNPTAPEGTPADSQTQTQGDGAQVCFSHTLQNTGDVADYFTVTVAFPQGDANATLYGPDGQPLAQRVLLQPGEEILVRACYSNYGDGVLEATLTVTGERGTSNQTTDILRPEPVLGKSVTLINGQPPKNDPETGEPIMQVREGDTVTYVLTVNNIYGADLTNVEIVDPLPRATEYVSAVPAPDRVEGEAGSQQLVWSFPTLADGVTPTFEITVRVTDRAQMGEAITNAFDLVSTEVTAESPDAKVYVPIEIDVEKVANVKTANVGDRVTFTLTVTNPSPVAALEPVDVIDVLADPTALGYIAGTATIRYSGSDETAPAEPSVQTETLEQPIGNHAAGDTVEEVMRWQLPKLEPKQTATITYEMRVEPGAANSEELENFVLAEGEGPGGASDIAQDNSDEVIRRTLERFKPVGDLLGLVYVDRNRSGTYDKGFDTPVNRARVVLAGGRISVTDKDGRYSFMNVPLGSHAVRLDPGTVPYPPLVKPQEGGLVGTQLVHVRGLDHADFPLAPLSGDIDVIRRTMLSAGPLTVTKIVYVTGDSYTVNLYLDSTSAVDIALSDPLPEGATLLEGTAGYTGSIQQPRIISYRFSFEGEPREAVTDPELEWR